MTRWVQPEPVPPTGRRVVWQTKAFLVYFAPVYLGGSITRLLCAAVPPAFWPWTILGGLSLISCGMIVFAVWWARQHLPGLVGAPPLVAYRAWSRLVFEDRAMLRIGRVAVAAGVLALSLWWIP